MLKFVLLGFLNYTPMTGYELEGWINASTGNFWHAELSQIYKTLKQLEKSGELTSHIEPQEGRPDRRVYTITESGKANLDQWLSTPILDEVDKKDPLLLKLFFASPADRPTIFTQLRIQLRLHQQKLDHYRQQSPDEIMKFAANHPELLSNAPLWEATRRHGELYEEMYIRWIEETLQQFESHP
jgi:PadR family transcriptional regulator, regulatory protein AphA